MHGVGSGLDAWGWDWKLVHCMHVLSRVCGEFPKRGNKCPPPNETLVSEIAVAISM